MVGLVGNLNREVKRADLFLEAAARVDTKHPEVRWHLAAHSAGVHPLIHLLEKMKRPARPVTSCTLLAPLCSVELAQPVLMRAFDRGVLARGALACEGLREDVELADGVGDTYGPSLSILVSRVLERDCYTPILSLEKIWDPSPEGERWPEYFRDYVRKWRLLRAKQASKSKFLGFGDEDDGRQPVSPGHQSFERDQQVLTRLVQHCRLNAKIASGAPPG